MPYYIGNKEHEINLRLEAIEVPREISHAPHSVTDRKYWKASEWRTFIFYCLVVLHGILPRKFLQHFFLFVHGVYCLLGDSIKQSTINVAEVCLTRFVIQTEDLYGLKSCSFNVHQLVLYIWLSQSNTVALYGHQLLFCLSQATIICRCSMVHYLFQNKLQSPLFCHERLLSLENSALMMKHFPPCLVCIRV